MTLFWPIFGPPHNGHFCSRRRNICKNRLKNFNLNLVKMISTTKFIQYFIEKTLSLRQSKKYPFTNTKHWNKYEAFKLAVKSEIQCPNISGYLNTRILTFCFRKVEKFTFFSEKLNFFHV